MSIFSEKTRANKSINSLFIGLVIVLSSGCSGLHEASPEVSPEPSPNQSDGQYPAEISGEVTIAETFKWATAIPVPADEGRVFWIQKITIKNVSYPEPIEASASSGGWTKWRLVYDDEERWWRTCVPEDIYIDKGESTTFWTYCEMPRYVEIGDVQIRYTGQEPYSYGELTFIDEVEAYDFFTKKGIEEEDNTSNTEYVYLGQRGAEGHEIILENNPNATNPTWEQLRAFLAEDNTSEHLYDYEHFVCADFAEQLHNRAEAAGIKAGYVSITLPDYIPPAGFAPGHALNVFRLVETSKNCYIDSTNSLTGMSWGDSIAFIEAGKPYEAAPAALIDLIQENGKWYWFGFGLHGLAVNDATIGEVDEQW